MLNQKPLNKFQIARAPVAVRDDQMQEVSDALPGKFFQPRITKDPVSGVESKTWYDCSREKYVCELRRPDGSVSTRVEAKTLDGLLSKACRQHGEQEAERRDAEISYREEYPDSFPSLRDKSIHEWLRDFMWGQIFSNYLKELSDESGNEYCQALKARVLKLYGMAGWNSPDSIEVAYLQLLDEGKLDEFEDEAAANKATRLAEEQEAQEEKARLEAKKVYVPEPTWRDRVAYRAILDSENRKLAGKKGGLAELRRRALFSGEKITTVPSTGNAPRLPE